MAEQARTAATEANKQQEDALAAKKDAEEKARTAQEEAEQLRAKLAETSKRRAEPPEAEGPEEAASSGDGSRRAGRPREDGHVWVPPGALRHLNGTQYGVDSKKVFPHDCLLEEVPTSSTWDDDINQQVYQCRVADLNPELEKGRSHMTVVKIPDDKMPEEAKSWLHASVEFDELSVTPYETEQDVDEGRIEYTLHATGVHLAT